jgi:hypothetical protein
MKSASIKDNGERIRKKDMENVPIKMAQLTKVIGWKIAKKALEFSFILMAITIAENGLTACLMVKVNLCKWLNTIKSPLKKLKTPSKESNSGQTVQNTRDNFATAKNMAKESWSGKIRAHTRENGKMDWWTVKDFKHSQMENATMANTPKINSTGWAKLFI